MIKPLIVIMFACLIFAAPAFSQQVPDAGVPDEISVPQENTGEFTETVPGEGAGADDSMGNGADIPEDISVPQDNNPQDDVPQGNNAPQTDEAPVEEAATYDPIIAQSGVPQGELPRTGANETMWLFVSGLLLVSFGAGIFYLTRSKTV